MLAVRRAREADLDRLLEIHQVAFPDPRGVPQRLRNFQANPLGALSDLRVAVLDGVLVGHAFLFPLRFYFGGKAVAVGGIASVAIAAEARGRGLGRKLLAHLHGEAEAAGAPLALLYAFRQRFYAELGYTPVASTKRLRLTPAALPRAWNDDEGILVRAVRAEDRAALESVYVLAAHRAMGRLERPAAFWDYLIADERRTWLLASRSAVVTGYVAFTVEQPQAHDTTRVIVHELVALDAPTRRRLLGALGALRGQADEIELEIAADDPLEFALVDIDGHRRGTERLEHELGVVAGGPMVRILDVGRALAGRGYSADGEATLVVADERAPVRLAVRGGAASVAWGAPAGEGALHLTSTTLASIAFGGLTPSQAHALGKLVVDGEPDAALARADQLFASPPFFSFDPF